MQDMLKDTQGTNVLVPDANYGVRLYYWEGVYTGEGKELKYGNQLAISECIIPKGEEQFEWNGRVVRYKDRAGKDRKRYMYDRVRLKYELIGGLIEALIKLTPKEYLPEKYREGGSDYPVQDLTQPKVVKPRRKELKKSEVSKTDIDEFLA